MRICLAYTYIFFVQQTLSFVRSVLQPESVGETRVRAKETKRYDMQYRYDHTLRVADIGGEIARSEGLSEEALPARLYAFPRRAFPGIMICAHTDAHSIRAVNIVRIPHTLLEDSPRKHPALRELLPEATFADGEDKGIVKAVENCCG